MDPCRKFAVALTPLICVVAGCQDWNRRSIPPTDLKEPPAAVQTRVRAEGVDLPAQVEDMIRARRAYIEQLTRLEKTYLEIGDVNRANWARRQRERTDAVEVYPYLADDAIDSNPGVAPEKKDAEADALFDRAKAKLDEVRGVPLAGFLQANREKAREALALFEELLRRYPKSDKVDDAAFYCGEIYKEYLRKEDPDDELSIKYYRWAVQLDPKTPHAARFQCAVVEDFRRHNRKAALELYHDVLRDEPSNISNLRFAASRIEQLTDEEGSHLRPREEQEPSRGEIRKSNVFTARAAPPDESGASARRAPSEPPQEGEPERKPETTVARQPR